MKENGRTGECSKNLNGTQDCGLAQINTSWLPHFAKYGITSEHLYGNACTNIQASAYILRWNFERKKHWYDATIAYNIGPYRWTPGRLRIGQKYANDVLSRWWGFYDWVEQRNARPPG
jgi:soluble lytic murein transglycosylase-like protein